MQRLLMRHRASFALKKKFHCRAHYNFTGIVPDCSPAEFKVWSEYPSITERRVPGQREEKLAYACDFVEPPGPGGKRHDPSSDRLDRRLS
jgi:hypothetical protein